MCSHKFREARLYDSLASRILYVYSSPGCYLVPQFDIPGNCITIWLHETSFSVLLLISLRFKCVFVCIPGAPKIVPPFKYVLIRHAENNGNSGNSGFGAVSRRTPPNPLFPLFSACSMSTYLKGETI